MKGVTSHGFLHATRNYRFPIIYSFQLTHRCQKEHNSRGTQHDKQYDEKNIFAANQLQILQMQRIAPRSGCCAAECLSVLISPGMCMQCNLICLSLAVLSNAGCQPYSHPTNQLLSRQRPSSSTLHWVLVPFKMQSSFYSVTLQHWHVSSGSMSEHTLLIRIKP